MDSPTRLLAASSKNGTTARARVTGPFRTRVSRARWACCCVVLLLTLTDARGQPLGTPDREHPGDGPIQAYLARETTSVFNGFDQDLKSVEAWKKARPGYRSELFYMLGLQPRPDRTPLCATITGSLRTDDYIVDMIHYQSRPGLYVTGNLYRPAVVAANQRLPAIFYVCGHSGRGRNGNKTAFQSHGIWFARHGYVCLIVDTLQLGEIGATHHGTYRENRWWWHSRGYTPAGVECWNGIRGIDYLSGRSDVDPERIAVTGISGGGASTFWIAAADPRVKVAVAVSGMADLPAYVPHRVINGHCDCMFFYNTFRWPWARIAALIAPRPQLFVNSDNDQIFPMDANQRVIQRLERLYSLYGAGDRVDAVVSIGGHAYRQDIRQSTFRFLNLHLKGQAAEVTDSEVDLVRGPRSGDHPIAPERLRVFRTDDDLPTDQRNTVIDRHFVPMAEPPLPQPGQFARWRSELLRRLRAASFRTLPARGAPGQPLEPLSNGVWTLASEPGLRITLRALEGSRDLTRAARIWLLIEGDQPIRAQPAWLTPELRPNDALVVCAPRGRGSSKWTQKNPPNYVERSHALLGTTVDAGRVGDIIAAARALRHQFPSATIHVAGARGAGILAAYAALFEREEIASVCANRPLTSHMQPGAPAFLNVLRVCDIPEVLGMLAPRRVTLIDVAEADRERIRALFESAGAAATLRLK